MTKAPQSATVGAFFFLSTRETRAAARLTCAPISPNGFLPIHLSESKPAPSNGHFQGSGYEFGVDAIKT